MGDIPKKINSIIPDADPGPPSMQVSIPTDKMAAVNGVRMETFHTGSTDIAKAKSIVQKHFNEWSQANLDMDVVSIEQSIVAQPLQVAAVLPHQKAGVHIMYHFIISVWYQPTKLPVDVKVLLMQVQEACRQWANTGLDRSDPESVTWKTMEGVMAKLTTMNDKVFEW